MSKALCCHHFGRWIVLYFTVPSKWEFKIPFEKSAEKRFWKRKYFCSHTFRSQVLNFFRKSFCLLGVFRADIDPDISLCTHLLIFLPASTGIFWFLLIFDFPLQRPDLSVVVFAIFLPTKQQILHMLWFSYLLKIAGD